MRTLAIVLGLCGVLVIQRQAAAQRTLELLHTIPLPQVRGRFDHFAADVQGQRLFVAALGNNTLEILDLHDGKRVHSITGLHKPTGVAYLPESNRIYVANGDEGTCKVYDGNTFQVLTSIGGLDDADNVRYDAAAQRLFVGYGAGALGIIDVTRNAMLGAITFAGHPEAFQLEKRGTRIFVNVPDAKEVTVVDRSTRAVTDHWSLHAYRANFPMALDEGHHRLFTGSRQPAKLIVLNTDNGKVIADVDIVGDTDDLFYDASNRLLYISGGAGFISVVQQVDADHYTPLENIPTASGARTSYFLPELKRFAVAVPEHGGQPAAIRVYRTP